jgi:hypothetical protein
MLTIFLDHDKYSTMNTIYETATIPISKFKATCLSVLAHVKKTGRTLTVTRYGQALAQVSPPAPAKRHQSWLGCMSAKSKIAGDVISPVIDENEWRVMHR